MKRLLLAALLSAATAVHAQVLPVRDQARVINEILAERATASNRPGTPNIIPSSGMRWRP